MEIFVLFLHLYSLGEHINVEGGKVSIQYGFSFLGSNAHTFTANDPSVTAL